MTKTDLTLRVANGSPLTHAQQDANFQRLMYWSGAWAAGTYEAQEVVAHKTILWIANKQTTLEPAAGSADWDPLARSPTALASMSLANPPAALPDLGATYDPITQYDQVDYTPINITADTTAGTFGIANAGVYLVTMFVSLSHNEVNAGRTFNLRVFNVTKATAGNPFAIFTGRNQGGTVGQVAGHSEIPTAEESDLFRIEIGGGDSYSAITIDSLAWTLNRIA